MSSNSTIGKTTSGESDETLLPSSEPSSSLDSLSTDVPLTTASTLIPQQGSLTSLAPVSSSFISIYHSPSFTSDLSTYSSSAVSSSDIIASSIISSSVSEQHAKTSQYDPTTTSYSIITPSLSILSSKSSSMSTTPSLTPPTTSLPISWSSSFSSSLVLSSSLSSSNSNFEKFSLDSSSSTSSPLTPTAVSPSYTSLSSISTTSSEISAISKVALSWSTTFLSPSTISNNDATFSSSDRYTSTLIDTSLIPSAVDSSITSKPSMLNTSDSSSTVFPSSESTISMPKLASTKTYTSPLSSNSLSSSSLLAGTKSSYSSPSLTNNAYSLLPMASTSGSSVPLTTQEASTTVFSTSSMPTSSPVYNTGALSSSEGSKTIYYFYTQAYDITGSTTTFATGLPTTIALAKSAVTSFSVPSSTITADMSFYQHWLDGSLDNNQNQGTSKSNTGTIVGSVVGSVGGVLISALVVWFIVLRKRKTKKTFKGTDLFYHQIGRRTGFPTTAQAKEASLQAQDSGSQQENGQTASANNPFSNEFNFKARRVPPVPPARDAVATNNPSHIIQNNFMNSENRFSYGSSFTYSSSGSSTQNGFSTLSSNSIRLGHGLDNNAPTDESCSVENNSQGFLREII